MWTPGITELIILAGIFILLFGGKKIPEIARGLGSGIRDFKKAKNEISKEATDQIKKS